MYTNELLQCHFPELVYVPNHQIVCLALLGLFYFTGTSYEIHVSFSMMHVFTLQLLDKHHTTCMNRQ